MALLLLVTHTAVGAAGFALGVYMLPILVAPTAPTEASINEMSAGALFTGEFHRDLQDSDAFHWGEGTVSVSKNVITHVGRLAPGPDYKMYLSVEYLETEKEFKRLKPGMALVGDVKTFENFAVTIPDGIDPASYNTVIIWCETFGEFITSARYQ